jgi:hypothetical protein
MPVEPRYFKLIETNIRETMRTPEGVPLYTIKRTVQYFFDEAMTKIDSEKVFTNENIPYNKEWDAMLSEIYNLPRN